MNKQYFPIYFLIGFAVFSIVLRLLPHPPNFAPIAALALFCGVYAAKTSRWFLLAPLVAMFLSDLAIGFYDWRIMTTVYGSFGFIGLMGALVQRHKNIGTILLGTLAGSLLFYFTTNFAVWAFGAMYPHTLEGLLMSYTMAIPFFKFTVLGDLFYVFLFFGTYELAAVLQQSPMRQRNRVFSNFLK